jgi:hypothetical protein
MSEQVVEAVVLTIILAIPGWEILKYVMKALMFYTLHRIKEEAELPTKINPSDHPISETGQDVKKAAAEPIFAGHCDLCCVPLVKVKQGSYQCPNCQREFICPEELKDMSTSLVSSDDEFKSRAKKYREAILGQEFPPKYSIEPHGQPGEYALYFGRDMYRHGANLCKLSEFDAKGEETRKMIVAALNEKYTEKY